MTLHWGNKPERRKRQSLSAPKSHERGFQAAHHHSEVYIENISTRMSRRGLAYLLVIS